MTKQNKEQLSEAAGAIGQKGGRSNFKKHGHKHMKEIGKRGAEVRWGKK